MDEVLMVIRHFLDTLGLSSSWEILRSVFWVATIWFSLRFGTRLTIRQTTIYFLILPIIARALYEVCYEFCEVVYIPYLFVWAIIPAALIFFLVRAIVEIFSKVHQRSVARTNALDSKQIKPLDYKDIIVRWDSLNIFIKLIIVGLLWIVPVIAVRILAAIVTVREIWVYKISFWKFVGFILSANLLVFLSFQALCVITNCGPEAMAFVYISVFMWSVSAALIFVKAVSALVKRRASTPS